MATVNVRKAVRYGFVLLGYFIAVFIAGGIIAWIGSMILVAGLSGDGALALLIFLIGGLIWLIGVLIIFAGLLGVNYKVIADGVTRGIENSSGFGGSGGQDQTALERRERGSASRSDERSSRRDRGSANRNDEESSRRERGSSDPSD